MEGSTLYAERLSLDEQPLDRLCDDYLDLHTDYEGLHALCQCDELLRRSVDFAGGIRILRQQPWEALCTFILSQNNNIKRITGLVERLCENFGEPVSCKDGSIWYTFPTAQRLAELTPEQLAPGAVRFSRQVCFGRCTKGGIGGDLTASNLSSAHSKSYGDANADQRGRAQGGPVRLTVWMVQAGLSSPGCLDWARHGSVFPRRIPCPGLPIAGWHSSICSTMCGRIPEICDKK